MEDGDKDEEGEKALENDENERLEVCKWRGYFARSDCEDMEAGVFMWERQCSG